MASKERWRAAAVGTAGFACLIEALQADGLDGGGGGRWKRKSCCIGGASGSFVVADRAVEAAAGWYVMQWGVRSQCGRHDGAWGGIVGEGGGWTGSGVRGAAEANTDIIVLHARHAVRVFILSVRRTAAYDCSLHKPMGHQLAGAIMDMGWDLAIPRS